MVRQEGAGWRTDHFSVEYRALLAADGTLSKDVMGDLLHLNENSYRTWAESVEPKVKELLGEK